MAYNHDEYFCSNSVIELADGGFIFCEDSVDDVKSQLQSSSDEITLRPSELKGDTVTYKKTQIRYVGHTD